MKTEVITTGGNESVTDAANSMRVATHRAGYWWSAAIRIEGIVTDRDLLVSRLGNGHNPSECQVSRTI